MMEKKIGCLPVVEGETLVGLVTETDLLRLIAG
jgi:CBS domain-containing protein